MKYKIHKIHLIETILCKLANNYGLSCIEIMCEDEIVLNNFQKNSVETSNKIKKVFCSIGIDATKDKNYLVNYCVEKDLNYFYYLYNTFYTDKIDYRGIDYRNGIIANENLMKILFIFFNNVDRSVFSDKNNKNIFDIINLKDLYNLILANIFFREIENDDKCSTIFNFIKDNMYDSTYTCDILFKSSSLKKIICENIWGELNKIVTEPVLYLASKIYKYDYVTLLNKSIYQDQHIDVAEHEYWQETTMYNAREADKKNIKTKLSICMYNTNSDSIYNYNIFDMSEESFMFLLKHNILRPVFN